MLADIARAFLQARRVIRYRMKKVADMADDEVIRACHWYCEEQGLTREWAAFRAAHETEGGAS